MAVKDSGLIPAWRAQMKSDLPNAPDADIHVVRWHFKQRYWTKDRTGVCDRAVNRAAKDEARRWYESEVAKFCEENGVKT